VRGRVILGNDKALVARPGLRQGYRGASTRSVACPSLKLRQGVLDGAQKPLVLELLLFPLPLGLPSLLLFLPPLGLLGGLLGGFGLLLLGPALGLLILVADYGTGGLLGPSLDLLVRGRSP
jgi:hypothetical protein